MGHSVDRRILRKKQHGIGILTSFGNLKILDHMCTVEDNDQKQVFIINIYVKTPVTRTLPKLE